MAKKSSNDRLVVNFLWACTSTYLALGSMFISSLMVDVLIPSQILFNLDQLVTQWVSENTLTRGGP